MSRLRLLVPALLLAAVAACDESTGPDGGLTAVQTTQVGATMQDEVENDVDAMIIEAAVTPSFEPAPGMAQVVAPCVAPSNTDGHRRRRHL
jgi:hypothetical protein